MHLLGQYNTISTYTVQGGIYILVKKSLGKIENVETMDNSTLLFYIKNNDNKTLTIAAIYAPSDADNIFYFEEVDNLLQNRAISSDYQMIIGDYNTTLNYSRDRKGYSKTIDTHKNCRALIQKWVEDKKWIDAFDHLHPGKKSYTWESKQKKGQKGRIDHCLVSPNLIKHTKYISHTSIGEHLTDHRAIEVIINWAKAKRGKGNFRAQKGLEKNIYRIRN